MMQDSTEPTPPGARVFYIGTSGWIYNHWKGRFYPQNLPQKRWFDYYAGKFSVVEVNATFYGTFKDQTYNNWRERAPQGFGYVLKAPRLITHRKYLLGVEEDIRTFYCSCSLLEDNFQLILLQVAPNTPYDPPRLRRALSAFPDQSRVAVEFRRDEWFNLETLGLLQEVGAVICNVDSPRHKLADNLTSSRAYLRLHGRNNWYAYNYSNAELAEIADLAHSLVNKGAKQVYIFFNNDFEGYAPANAMTLQGMLG